jgi:hypothetical protein
MAGTPSMMHVDPSSSPSMKVTGSKKLKTK